MPASIIAITAILAGCSKGHLDVVRDDRVTWRSTGIALDRQGGSVEVRVDARSRDELRICLFDVGNREPPGDLVAVAGGSSSSVVFTALPPGDYGVLAFLDMNGDGRTVLELTDAGPECPEPHSSFRVVSLAPGSRKALRLHLEPEES